MISTLISQSILEYDGNERQLSDIGQDWLAAPVSTLLLHARYNTALRTLNNSTAHTASHSSTHRGTTQQRVGMVDTAFRSHPPWPQRDLGGQDTLPLSLLASGNASLLIKLDRKKHSVCYSP